MNSNHPLNFRGVEMVKSPHPWGEIKRFLLLPLWPKLDTVS